MKRFANFAVAALVVFPIFLVWDWMQERSRAAIPASEWFEVKQTFVPDHMAGEDPDVIYKRNIKKAFTADWFVAIYPASSPDEIACSGSARWRYRPQKHPPNSKMALSKYVGERCNLPPDRYFGLTRWEIMPDGHRSPKIIERPIPSFNVYACEADRCVK